jgi:hypothetical protein
MALNGPDGELNWFIPSTFLNYKWRNDDHWWQQWWLLRRYCQWYNRVQLSKRSMGSLWVMSMGMVPWSMRVTETNFNCVPNLDSTCVCLFVDYLVMSAIDRLVSRWSVSAIDHCRLIINIDDWACRLLLSLTSPMSVHRLFLFVSWCRLLLRHLWGAIAMGLEIATRWVVNVGRDGRISQPFRRCWHRWCPPWPLMVICCQPWPNASHFCRDS